MYKLFIINILSLIFILSSCRKDSDTFTFFELPQNNDSTVFLYSGDIQNAFNSLGVKKQIFSCNTNAAGCISGNQMTRICYDADDFVKNDGNVVTGEFEIELMEIYNRADMIMSNKPTVSNGQILVSGGELHIAATQNGQALQLRAGATLEISAPQKNNNFEPFQVFYGETLPNGTVNWDLAADNPPVQTAEFQINEYDWLLAYTFNCPNLGWVNLDYFYYQVGSSNLTDMKIYVPDSCTLSNTALFLVFKNYNSVSHLPNFSPEQHYFGTGDGAYRVPVGEAITLVAVAEFTEDNFYAAFKDIVVQNNHTDTLIFEPFPLSQLKTKLEADFGN